MYYSFTPIVHNLNFPADDLNKIKQLVQSCERSSGEQVGEQDYSLMSGNETKSENGLHENHADEENDETDNKAAPVPIQFLLNVSNSQEILVNWPPDFHDMYDNNCERSI